MHCNGLVPLSFKSLERFDKQGPQTVLDVMGNNDPLFFTLDKKFFDPIKEKELGSEKSCQMISSI